MAASQRRAAVARDNLGNQEQMLELARARLEGGRGSRFDVARARAQRSLTLWTIPAHETQIRRSLFRLSVLLGEQPAALEDELLAPKPLRSPPGVAAIGDPAALLRRRPDIRVAERELAAATARIGVNTADLFPKLSLTGNVGAEAAAASALSGAPAFTYLIGLRLGWAAFDLGRVRARIDQADARAQAALARYEKAVLIALEETEGAIVELERQREQREALPKRARRGRSWPATGTRTAYRISWRCST